MTFIFYVSLSLLLFHSVFYKFPLLLSWPLSFRSLSLSPPISPFPQWWVTLHLPCMTARTGVGKQLHTLPSHPTLGGPRGSSWKLTKQASKQPISPATASLPCQAAWCTWGCPRTTSRQRGRRGTPSALLALKTHTHVHNAGQPCTACTRYQQWGPVHQLILYPC